jgi:hypothetical protein
MAILKLTDKATKIALDHPLLKAKARIGRGAFCAVYDNGASVLKLTCDEYQYAFYTHADRPIGSYFPTLLADLGCVGGTREKPLYLVEMERLQPIRFKAKTAADAWNQRKNLVAAVNGHRQHVWNKFEGRDCDVGRLIQIACLRGAAESGQVGRELGLAANRLASFCELVVCSPDLHRSNFMLRGSQLVLNDVVKDHFAIYRNDLFKVMPKELVDPYLASKVASRASIR